MRRFTNGELAGMQRTQQGAMMDLCRIADYAAGAGNAYGQKPAVYTNRGQATICGYDPTATGEVLQGSEVVTIDAALRLPVDTVIDSRDRVTLLERFGAALVVPLTFDVIGNPEQGPSGLVVKLRRIHD